MNANIQTLKEDMAHTKETLDNVNNTLQAILRQRHHSRSSRSSRTRSSRPRDDHQGQEDGQARPPPRPHAPHVDAPGAHGQGPHQREQEGQGESQDDPLLAQELLRQQHAAQAQARQDQGHRIKRTWNKQTKSVASSSTVRDLKLNHKWKKIEKITVNATPMTIGATTTAQEENLNMSQVNTTPAMAMADMEEIPIEMTTSDTGIEHPAT